MKLVNTLPYNEKWDKKLNWLMDNSTKTTQTPYYITFKVCCDVSRYRFLGLAYLFPSLSIKHSTYTVWTENKNNSYGHLYEYNSEVLSEVVKYSPSKATMGRLFELEKSLLSESMYD